MIDDMQVYIANLGKYNEGELVGDWFSFPLDEEVIAERIGLMQSTKNTQSMIRTTSRWRLANTFPSKN